MVRIGVDIIEFELNCHITHTKSDVSYIWLAGRYLQILVRDSRRRKMCICMHKCSNRHVTIIFIIIWKIKRSNRNKSFSYE